MNFIINQNVEKFIILVNVFYLLFLRDMCEGYVSLKDADDEQSNFANKLNKIIKGITSIEKSYF